jgi:hypothetical protein
MNQSQNFLTPANVLITPPDQFNRVHVFSGLTKHETLAYQLFLIEYSRELYNRELQTIIMKECIETAKNFFTLTETEV